MKKTLILLSAFFLFNFSYSEIIISEIHYNPRDEDLFLGDDLEFIEITNTDESSIDISGYFFEKGITYTFPSNTTMAPNESIVLAKNQTQLEAFSGTTVFGQYTGGLKNSGERVTLYTSFAEIVFDVEYDDFTPWPTLADGAGRSLEYIGSGEPNEYSSWVASSTDGGTPNSFTSTSASQQFPIIVNEISANPSEGNLEQIELHNTSDSTVDISTWWVTDDIKTPNKYQIGLNTTIEANGYFVITSDQFGENSINTPFGLSSKGEGVFIFAASFSNSTSKLTGYSHGFEYSVMDEDQSYGLLITSEGEYEEFVLEENTFGSDNSDPEVGPLVIKDIMYLPSSSLDEFLIIKNISDSTVSSNSPYLVDSNAIRIDAIDFKFDFTSPVQFASDESFILTNVDPETFRNENKIDENIQIFQFNGKLADSGEKLEIEIPVLRDTITLASGGIEYDNHFKVMDEVNYENSSPWPSGADGTGSYIHRRENGVYANDPALWFTTNTILLSSKKVSPENTFTLYPSPAKGYITINHNETLSYEDYSILNSVGSKVLEGTLLNNAIINISSLPNGFYTFKAGDYSRKFIKE